MNVLFTSNVSQMGGGETSLLLVIKQLKNKCNVYFVCDKDGTFPDLLRDEGIPVYIINFTNKKKLLYNIRILRKLLIKNNISVIHNNEWSTSILFGYICRFTRRKIKNYWTCHGQWYSFSCFKRFISDALIDGIFCVSQNVKKNLVRYGFKKDKCLLNYLGINVNSISKNDFSLKNELGLKKDDFIIGTVARFDPVKGQRKAVKAIIKLLSEYKSLHYVIVGGCWLNNPKNKSYLDSVKNIINENNLNDRIHLLGERRNVSEIMDDFNILLVPSDSESLGMVVLEALIKNIPVISTPCEGPQEILNNNRNFICDSNDSEGIYLKLNPLLRDINIYNNLKKETYLMNKRVVSMFNVQRTANNYLKKFEADYGDK